MAERLRGRGGDRPSEARAARTPAHAWSRDGDAARRPTRARARAPVRRARRRLASRGAARGGVRRRARRARPRAGFAPEGARSGRPSRAGACRTPTCEIRRRRDRGGGAIALRRAASRHPDKPARPHPRRGASGCSRRTVRGRTCRRSPGRRPRSSSPPPARGRPRASEEPRPSPAARAPCLHHPTRRQPGSSSDRRADSRRRTPRGKHLRPSDPCAASAHRARDRARRRARAIEGMTPRRRGRRALSLRKAPFVRVKSGPGGRQVAAAGRSNLSFFIRFTSVGLSEASVSSPRRPHSPAPSASSVDTRRTIAPRRSTRSPPPTSLGVGSSNSSSAASKPPRPPRASRAESTPTHPLPPPSPGVFAQPASSPRAPWRRPRGGRRARPSRSRRRTCRAFRRRRRRRRRGRRPSDAVGLFVAGSSSSVGRSVRTTRSAPSLAATTPGSAGPAPSSTTDFPRTTSGWSQRCVAIGAAASQTRRAVASRPSPGGVTFWRTVTGVGPRAGCSNTMRDAGGPRPRTRAGGRPRGRRPARRRIGGEAGRDDSVKGKTNARAYGRGGETDGAARCVGRGVGRRRRARRDAASTRTPIASSRRR